MKSDTATEPATTSHGAPDSLLNLQQVVSITGLKKSSVYKYMRDYDFPQRVSLGGNRIAWKSSDIQAWIKSRPVVVGRV